MEGFNRQKGAGKEVSSKKWIISCKVTFLWGRAGSQADYLTSADQVIPDQLVKGHILRRS